MLYPDGQRTELMRFAKNQKNNPTCIPQMRLRGYVRAPKFEIDLSESWQRNQWRVQSWLQSLNNFLCYYMLFFSHSLRTLVCTTTENGCGKQKNWRYSPAFDSQQFLHCCLPSLGGCPGHGGMTGSWGDARVMGGCPVVRHSSERWRCIPSRENHKQCGIFTFNTNCASEKS